MAWHDQVSNWLWRLVWGLVRFPMTYSVGKDALVLQFETLTVRLSPGTSCCKSVVLRCSLFTASGAHSYCWEPFRLTCSSSLWRGWADRHDLSEENNILSQSMASMLQQLLDSVAFTKSKTGYGRYPGKVFRGFCQNSTVLPATVSVSVAMTTSESSAVPSPRAFCGPPSNPPSMVTNFLLPQFFTEKANNRHFLFINRTMNIYESGIAP